MFFLKSTYYNSKGFTLVEALIALFAFSLVFTASLLMVARALKGNQFTVNELMGQYLATEVLESVDALRSDRVLLGTWVQDMVFQCGSGCAIDSTPMSGISFTKCTNITDPCAQLNLSSNGLYTHTAGTPTMFYRLVTLSYSATDPTAVIVRAEVSWSMPGIPNRSIVVRKVIKDWY